MHVFEAPMTSAPTAVVVPYAEMHRQLLARIIAADPIVAYGASSGNPQARTRCTAALLHTIIDRIGQQIVAERGSSAHFTIAEAITFCNAFSDVVCLSGHAYPGQQLPGALEERLARVAEDTDEHDLRWHECCAVTLAGLHQWFTAAVNDTDGAAHGGNFSTAELRQVVDRFLAAIVKQL